MDDVLSAAYTFVAESYRYRIPSYVRGYRDSDDLAAEVVALLWAAGDRLRFENATALRAWLKAVALGRLMDWSRHARAKKNNRGNTACLDYEPAARSSSLADLEAADLRRYLLSGLSARDSRGLAMWLDGHSTEDIAEQLGCSLRTVHRLIAAQRGRLGKELH
jgi:RNA polymerase sigma factor (sigma-70 family)